MKFAYQKAPRFLRLLAFPFLASYILWEVIEEEKNFAGKYGLDKT